MATITIEQLSHPKDVTRFLRNLKRVIDDETITINFSNRSAFPAACVPICGIIDNLRKQGKTVNCNYFDNSFISRIHLNNPYIVGENSDSLAFPFSKIWLFSDFSEVTKLVDAYIDELTNSVNCSNGLVEGLEWSLNETMDNVLQHSLSSVGYMMGVIHPSTNYALFSIFDNGQGIYNSLRDSVYHPRSAIDAISIAIQEGKTRDPLIGQGNGLWGLNNIIQSNQGKLEITSHGSSLVLYNDGTSKKFEGLPYLDDKNATTTVSFAFNYTNSISVAEALGGHLPIDIKYEEKLDDNDALHFVVNEETSGFGTRIAGERLRKKVINYLKRIDKPSAILIDFSGISMISSSFADEFIGKLIMELGFYRFNQLIKIKGVAPVVEQILNRSVSQRIATLFPNN